MQGEKYKERVNLTGSNHDALSKQGEYNAQSKRRLFIHACLNFACFHICSPVMMLKFWFWERSYVSWQRDGSPLHSYYLVHTTSWWIDSIFCFRCWLSCYVCICQEKVIPCLLRLEQANDAGLRAAVREALALVGYHKPVKGRGIRILSIDGGGLRYTLGFTPLPPTLIFTLRYELMISSL